MRVHRTCRWADEIELTRTNLLLNGTCRYLYNPANVPVTKKPLYPGQVPGEHFKFAHIGSGGAGRTGCTGFGLQCIDIPHSCPKGFYAHLEPTAQYVPTAHTPGPGHHDVVHLAWARTGANERRTWWKEESEREGRGGERVRESGRARERREIVSARERERERERERASAKARARGRQTDRKLGGGGGARTPQQHTFVHKLRLLMLSLNE